jgi:hypothetical protein
MIQKTSLRLWRIFSKFFKKAPQAAAHRLLTNHPKDFGIQNTFCSEHAKRA